MSIHNSRINQLLAFLEQDDKDSFTRFALAMEYLKVKEVEKARNLFEYLINNDPEYVGTYYHAGKLYEELNLLDLAIQTYSKGITISRNLNELHTANELQQALDDLNL